MPIKPSTTNIVIMCLHLANVKMNKLTRPIRLCEGFSPSGKAKSEWRHRRNWRLPPFLAKTLLVNPNPFGSIHCRQIIRRRAGQSTKSNRLKQTDFQAPANRSTSKERPYLRRTDKDLYNQRDGDHNAKSDHARDDNG